MKSKHKSNLTSVTTCGYVFLFIYELKYWPYNYHDSIGDFEYSVSYYCDNNIFTIVQA